MKQSCSGGLITPEPPHFLNPFQVVSGCAMGDVAIPTVKRVQPRMDLAERCAELALAILAVLFVARHINGQLCVYIYKSKTK